MVYLKIFLIASFTYITSFTYVVASSANDNSATLANRGSINANNKQTLPKYKIGSGNKYVLNLNGDPYEVVIAFVDSTDQKTVIEVFMQAKAGSTKMDIQMWQQFHLGFVNEKINIIKGILQIPQIGKPQVLPNEYLQGGSGVQMKSFLIGSQNEIGGKKINVEKLSMGGQTFESTHYRHVENGQTIDFWLSDDAKPIGLVKLSSAGGGSGMNYSMNYLATVSGVKAHIKESDAEPLNDIAKSFLPLLGANLFKF